MNEIKLPLGLSIAGHAIFLALLILLLPTKIPRGAGTARYGRD